MNPHFSWKGRCGTALLLSSWCTSILRHVWWIFIRRQTPATPRHFVDGRFKDGVWPETYGLLVTIFHDRGVSLDFSLRRPDVFEKCPVNCATLIHGNGKAEGKGKQTWISSWQEMDGRIEYERTIYAENLIIFLIALCNLYYIRRID